MNIYEIKYECEKNYEKGYEERKALIKSKNELEAKKQFEKETKKYQKLKTFNPEIISIQEFIPTNKTTYKEKKYDK